MKTGIQLLVGVFMIFLALTVSAAPLNSWNWRNPVVLTNGSPIATGPHLLVGMLFTNGQFIGVGQGGVAALSSDGTNWTEYATATTNQLVDVIYANGRYLAVGDGGAIVSSPNGTIWTLIPSGITNNLNCVAFGGGWYVAAAGNTVLVSTDGINWTTQGVSGLPGAVSLAYGDSGFVGVNNDSRIFFSANGLSWSTVVSNIFFVRSASVTNFLRLSCASYINGKFYCAGVLQNFSTSGDIYLLSSLNGSSWTTNHTGVSSVSLLNSLDYNFIYGMSPKSGGLLLFYQGSGGYFFPYIFDGSTISGSGTSYFCWATSSTRFHSAYGSGVWVQPQHNASQGGGPNLFASVDATNWVAQQQINKPYTGPISTYSGFAASNGLWLAVGPGGAARSTNGQIYYAVSNSPALNSIVWFKTNFVGVGNGGTVYVTSEGTNWTQKNSGTISNLRNVLSNGSLLVAVGDSGAIQTSTSGNIWSSRLSGSSLTLYGCAYGGGQFVVVGQLGTILTSSDGINWAGQDGGTLSNLLSVTYGPAGFLAVGRSGLVLTSLDGIDWTSQTTGSADQWESCSAANCYYLLVGDNGLVKTSPDGVNWFTQNLGANTGQNFLGAVFAGSRFTLVGTAGSIVDSNVFGPLFDLLLSRIPAGDKISAFAPVGTSFRIQSCNNLAAHNWIDIANFNNAAAISLWTNSPSFGGQIFYRCVSP